MNNKQTTILASMTIVMLAISITGIESAFGWHDFRSPTWATASHTYKCDSSLNGTYLHSSVSGTYCTDLASPASTWTNVSNSNWSLMYSSTGKIPIGSKLICYCDTLAETKRTLDKNGKITASNIMLNTHKQFSDTTQTTGAYKDYKSIMLHEMGHLLRLGHEALNSNSPMYYSMPDDTEKRTLVHHDRAAMTGQYPT